MSRFEQWQFFCHLLSYSGTGQISEKISCFCPVPKHDEAHAKREGALPFCRSGCSPHILHVLAVLLGAGRACRLSPALVIAVIRYVGYGRICRAVEYRPRHQHAHYRRHHKSAPMVARKKGGCPPFLQKRLSAAYSCSCGLIRRGACF